MAQIIQPKKLGMGLLIFAGVLFLCTSVALFIVKEGEKEKRVSLEKQLTEAKEEGARLSAELERLNSENESLESDLKNITTESKALEEEIAQGSAAIARLEQDIAAKENQLKELTAALAQEKEEKVFLTKKLADFQKLCEELKVRISQMEDEKKDLEEELVTLAEEKKALELKEEEQVELPKIVINAEKKIEGQVLVVNKDFDFVIVDMGLKDGLRKGDQITLTRNEKVLGQATVAKIYDNMSAANLVGLKGRDVKEGDRVEAMLK